VPRYSYPRNPRVPIKKGREPQGTPNPARQDDGFEGVHQNGKKEANTGDRGKDVHVDQMGIVAEW
jgi:hypothetical protein